MSMQYDDYLVTHIGNVNRGLHWMWERNIHNDKDVIENVMLNFEHDTSKYSPEEYHAYDLYFYGDNKSFKVKQDFDYAWLHHIHNNPHHWQYWILFEDDPKTRERFKALEMPKEYVYEMVADWWAFSWANDNLTEIFEWYYGRNGKKSHQNIIIFHDKTRKLVEDILSELETSVMAWLEEQNEKTQLPDGYTEVAHHIFANGSTFIEHHGIKGQEWGVRRFQYEDGSLTPEGRKRYLKEEERSQSDSAKTRRDSSSGSDASGGSSSGSDGSMTGGGKALELDPNEDRQKRLLNKLLSDGVTMANLTDDEFKKYLEDAGFDTKSMSKNDISSLREKATMSYVKARLDLMDKASSGSGGSSNGSGETGNADTTATGAGTAKGSSGSARSSSGAAAEGQQSQKNAAGKKPTADEVENATYKAIENLNKLKEGTIDEKDIIGATDEDFKNRIAMLTGMDLSNLSKKQIAALRVKIRNHYALQKWEGQVKANMSEIMKKFPDAADNTESFIDMLVEYTDIDVNALSPAEIEELKKKFEELSGVKDEEDEESDEDKAEVRPADEDHLEHSDTEDDEDLYGVPELKKFPMPDKKHVKSAIRFFNYVDPKYEKELAEAILEKAKEFGLNLKHDISVGDENRFGKYLSEDHLEHSGRKGQVWGIQNGPPYPLDQGTVKDIYGKDAKPTKDAAKESRNYNSKVSSKKREYLDEVKKLRAEYKELSKDPNTDQELLELIEMEITELKEQANARSRMAKKNTPEDSYYPMVSKHLLEEHPIEKLEDLKKLDPDANVAEIRKNINHPEGESDAGRWYNCPNCAAAFELTERGYDVIARPKKNGSNVENIEDFFEHGELTNAAYETEIPQYPKEPEKYSTDPAVRKQQEEKLDNDIKQFWNAVNQTTKEVEGSLTHDILAQGINARGFLVVGWFEGSRGLETGKRTTSFHAMNYKVDVDTHGKPFISIFDTQSRKKYKQNGGCDLKAILYDTDPREVYFMRTDNLDLSELIASAVYSNKKG